MRKAEALLDRAVQERMADAATETVTLTKRQTGIALFSAIAVLLSICLSAWAALSASKASRAALDALGTERAWMVAKGVRCLTARNLTIDDVTHAEGFVFLVPWVNYGKSPALRLSMQLLIRVLPREGDIPSFKVEWSKERAGAGVTGPGAEIFTAPTALGGDDARAFLEGRVRVIVYSVARYVDIFQSSVDRETESCQEIVINGTTQGENGPVPNHIIRSVGTQNTAS